MLININFPDKVVTYDNPKAIKHIVEILKDRIGVENWTLLEEKETVLA